MASTRALIHLDNFRHNIALLQDYAANRPLCLAVKADAYGHGAIAILREAEKLGIDHFGVSRISEAAELRRAGSRSGILLFTLGSGEELAGLWEYDVQPFVGDAEYFQRLVKLRKDRRSPLRVHIKTDSGMGRIGCPPSEVPALAAAIDAEPGFILEGVATHYPLSEQGADSFCREQIALLKNIRSKLKEAGIMPRYYHSANSGGILYHADDDFDMMRPGIAAYGYLPDEDSGQAERAELRPVMELRAEISLVKRVPRGTAISYGHTWRSSEECWIATINVGYADGYPRILSNQASVLINGRSYPQVGTICMDQCMVNLGPSQSPRPGATMRLCSSDPTPGAKALRAWPERPAAFPMRLPAGSMHGSSGSMWTQNGFRETRNGSVDSK